MRNRTATRLAAALILTAASGIAACAEAQDWRTIRSSRQVWDRNPLEVEIRYAAGELRVSPGEPSMLYDLELRYDQRYFEPITELDADRRRLRLGIRSLEGNRTMDLEEGSQAQIALARGIPLDLDLEFGAGEADLDLGGLSLRRLELSTGASETRIRFGSPNPITAENVLIEAGAAKLDVIGLANTRARRITFQGGVGSTTLDFTGAMEGDIAAEVKMGIGEVRLRFPRGAGVRINRSTFLTSFDSQGLIKQGNSFVSPNWESATHRITVDVEAALGSVKVEWVD